MSSGNYIKDFYAELDTLEKDAAAVGMTITSICKATGISRATPDRWRRECPTTVMLLQRMQQVVRDEEARLAALAAGAPPAPIDLSPELQQQ